MHILTQYVGQLLTNAQTWAAKDACLYLVIAMVVRGETRLKGVSACNDKVDVMTFLNQQVIPVLTGAVPPGHNVLVASCLKFVTTFRQQIPAATMLPLVGAAAQKLSSESAVVHTYAAHFLDKVLLIKDAGQPRYVNAQTGPQLLQAVQALLQQIA